MCILCYQAGSVTVSLTAQLQKFIAGEGSWILAALNGSLTVALDKNYNDLVSNDAYKRVFEVPVVAAAVAPAPAVAEGEGASVAAVE